MNALAVFIGGGLGSLARFGISKFITNLSDSIFPYATLMANILACLILAFGMNYFLSRELDNWQKYFLLVGFCGGFSTFSTFTAETFILLRSQNYFFALMNIILSVILCLFVFWAVYKNLAQN